ncbi:hypothetical protein DNTS_011611 [Danionella cerebrum]|uniref:KASH domain-containing protein n=1 Tax=Danionella cerebrum TaxID=2873325 RepID=A0A553QSQ0_9TELE|nr:hypothetical protein DNTS_011611 [Danionella translucida]
MSIKDALRGTRRVNTTGSDESQNDKQTHVNMHQSSLRFQFPEAHCPLRSSLVHGGLNELSKEFLSNEDLDDHQDVPFSLESCINLERRWMLWYEFMKEFSCLDDWLRAAEKMAASPNSSNNLQGEARIHLAQLDTLTHRSRGLLGMFPGAMGARLLDLTKHCGQRWDLLSCTLETVCRRLKHLVCQREDFERQREEMAVWLADLDLRLTELEHFSGKDTCSKMLQLQGFQEAVGESAGRLNDLLQRGEELIQRSEPEDAQAIESQLQELLLYCTRVFQSLGGLHTRLLSMRLVFEDDWTLCSPDSGCPSESLLEEESFMERIMAPHSNQDQLVLEWDPSVDIGGSISYDGTDSSSFSAAGDDSTKDPLRRRLLLSGIEKSLERAAPPRTPVPADIRDVRALCTRAFQMSTPESRESDPVTFDHERISAWLGQTQQLCSKAVQTEDVPQPRSSFSTAASGREEKPKEGGEYQENSLLQRHTCSKTFPAQSCDLQHYTHQHHQRQQERHDFLDSSEDNTRLESSCELGRPKSSTGSQMPLWRTGNPSALLLFGLFAFLLAVVIWPLFSLHETPCHRSNTLSRSFHLALHYRGPPPT